MSKATSAGLSTRMLLEWQKGSIMFFLTGWMT
jgi:hypothetical protein